MTFRHYIALAIVLGVLAGGLWAGYGYGKAKGIREGAAIADATRELVDAGWTEGSTRIRDRPPIEKPIPDLAERDATIITTVEYGTSNDHEAVEPVCPSASDVSPLLTDEPPAPDTTDRQWLLAPADLALDIRTDIVRIGGKPFGITHGTIKARTPHGEVRRPFSTRDELSSLSLWARDQPAPPARFALGPRKIKHWRMGWSAGPALVYGPGGEISAGVAVVWGAQF